MNVVAASSNELTQIEATLRSHAGVEDAVVLVREDKAGEQRLVGYVVRRQKAAEHARARALHVRVWKQLYDSTYRRKELHAGDFNLASWNSSYTGEPIAAAEMRIWVNETVARIKAFAPRRVLEIGCGTGLLLTRLAGECESYLGLDFSAEVLQRLEAYVATRSDLSRVTLRQGMANDLAFVPDDSVDVVILNSVVQYFPDVDYLLGVLREASRVTREGGHIFVGDVRSLLLLEAFHASVQLYKALGDETVEELRHRIKLAIDIERELVLDPRFFEKLVGHFKRVGCVEIEPKMGAYENEVSRFRYDVTMTIGEKMEVADVGQWVEWDAQALWKARLKEILAVESSQSIGIRGIPDKRAASATQALRQLKSTAPEAKQVDELRAAFATTPKGEDPNEVEKLARELEVPVCFRHFAANGTYDAIYNPAWREARIDRELAVNELRPYANAPCVSGGATGTLSSMQRFVRERLPQHLVPSTIVDLDAWPLTADGAVDRVALALTVEGLLPSE